VSGVCSINATNANIEAVLLILFGSIVWEQN